MMLVLQPGGPLDAIMRFDRPDSRMSIWRRTMTRTKIAVAAALMSAAALMPTMAQAQFSEPAAYQAAHPDRDVLNGGQLTPAARGARGQSFAPSEAYAAYPSPVAPVVRSRHRRPHR